MTMDDWCLMVDGKSWKNGCCGCYIPTIATGYLINFDSILIIGSAAVWILNK